MSSEGVFAIGSILAGKYRIDRLLGQGGMGAVYLAENTDIGRTIAIKVLKPELAQQPEALARFKQEARAAASIGHPGIVEILDLGTLPDGGAFIVMEALHGETLRERLQRQGNLSPTEAASLLAQVLDTLAAAHDKGVIHRDLKPDNIFLVDRPQPGTRILDFGISKLTGKGDMALTRTGAVMGTPLYMSPEQAKGSKDVGPWSDIYSVGAILYESLSGQPPFPGESYGEVLAKVLTEAQRPLDLMRPDTPAPLVKLIDQMLAKVGEWRPKDARSASLALRQSVGLAPTAEPDRDPAHQAGPIMLTQGAPVSEATLRAGTSGRDTLPLPGNPPSAAGAQVGGTMATPLERPANFPGPDTRPDAPVSVTPPAPTPAPLPMPTPAPMPAPAPAPAYTPGPSKSPLPILLGGGVLLALLAVAGLWGAKQAGLLGGEPPPEPKPSTTGASRPPTPPTPPGTTGAHPTGPVAVGTTGASAPAGPTGQTGPTMPTGPVVTPTGPTTSPADLCAHQRCAVYASTEHKLYEVDPLNPTRMLQLCAFGGDIPASAAVDDLAVAPNGELFAITATDLFTVDPRSCAGHRVGAVPQKLPFNGLSWGPGGKLLATDGSGALFRLDPHTAQVEPAGSLGPGMGCGGDLVQTLDGLYVAGHVQAGPPDAPDVLLRLDPQTLAVARVGLLPSSGIWGLGAWGGKLFGFDKAGHTLVIDPRTGAGQAAVTDGTFVWYGAGSTPLAPTH